MFNKKICLIFITLVFMLSLSVVSAVDTNTTDDVATSDVEEEPPSGSDEVLSTPDDVAPLESEPDYYLTGSDVVMYYKSGTEYEATLYHGANLAPDQDVVVNLAGVNHIMRTDNYGRIYMPLDLDVGKYVISVSYGNVSCSNNIDVLPIIHGNDVVKTYKSTTKYSAQFLNTDGQALSNTKVKFVLNGKTYKVKTNKKGIASIDINLKVGEYTIQAIHPNGFRISNKIIVSHSIDAVNVEKHYKSSKKFTARFYGTDGKVLAKKYVKFYIKKSYYTVKTNSKGVAKLSISSQPGKYKIVSINTQTGEKVKNKIKVLPTLSASSVSTFADTSSTFKVKLYKNDKLVKNAKVYVYILGSKKKVKTDANGVASLNFKLTKGTYKFVSVDPYTKYSINTKVTVIGPSIKADDMYAQANVSSEFKATLYNQDGTVAKNKQMTITINGDSKTLKTNSKGVASYSFKLSEGTYKVTCEDVSTGYTLDKKVTVLKPSKSKSYDQYGVSEDGTTIMAIGRPSAAGELSKYGYKFYQTEFLRVCSACGSHELYWGIFWAGSETADYGVFPATGYKEGGSAEGHIFCANCDSDWSVFGHNHGGLGGDLTPVSATILTTKDAAYALKSGSFIYP